MSGDYANGEPCDFGRQLEGLHDKLLRFAYSLTSDYNDSTDLLQETLANAWEHRSQYDEGTNLKAWTFKIMKNTFINNYRRNVRKKEIMDDSPSSYLLPESASRTEEYTDSSLIVMDIEREIGKLADDQRIPFLMHVDGYKYKEIADKLGLKLGTVKSRIFFARRNLREELEF